MPGAGIELYEFSIPFGYIFFSVKSTAKAFRSLGQKNRAE